MHMTSVVILATIPLVSKCCKTGGLLQMCPDPEKNSPLRGAKNSRKTLVLNVSEQIEATTKIGLRPKMFVAKQGEVCCEGGLLLETPLIV